MWKDMENTEKKGKLNNEKIGKIWKKSKLNSEKIWKIQNKSKLNSEKIWKIHKKIVKWYGRNVKWYGKYGGKVSWIVKRWGKYGRQQYPEQQQPPYTPEQQH